MKDERMKQKNQPSPSPLTQRKRTNGSRRCDPGASQTARLRLERMRKITPKI